MNMENVRASGIRFMKEPVGRLDLVRRRAFGLLMAVALVFVFVFAGCTWRPEIVKANPSLTYMNMVEGKVAILPVKFESGGVTPPERYNVTVALGLAIQQVRSGIPQVATPALQRAWEGAPEEQAFFLRAYDGTSIDPALLAVLRESIGARYLVLSRLNYEQRPVSIGTSETTESTLSGTLSIVESDSGHVVWEGNFSTSRSGVDNMLQPRPSAHALPFFSTFVDAWPKEPSQADPAR